MAKSKRRFWAIPFIAIAIVAALGGVVMLLWNSVLTDVLGVKKMTYVQAVGLFVLCKILFGSFRPGPPGGWRRGGAAWRTKLMNMTPEERERFKSLIRQRLSSSKQR